MDEKLIMDQSHVIKQLKKENNELKQELKQYKQQQTHANNNKQHKK